MAKKKTEHNGRHNPIKITLNVNNLNMSIKKSEMDF